MSNNYIVTVIIPSYNHEKYIAQSIKSVLNQTWKYIDLIVIDDGSIDSSPEIIKQLHNRYSTFRYILRKNKGLIQTLNEGLSLAKGEFICELASDDFLPPDSIEKRINFLIKNPNITILFGNGLIVKDNIITDNYILDTKRRDMFKQKDPIKIMINGTLPVFSTALFKKKDILEIGGFDTRFRYYEDLDTSILLSYYGQPAFIDEVVLYRRLHDTNVSTTTDSIIIEKILCYQKLLTETPLGKKYKRLINYKLKRTYLRLGKYINKKNTITTKEWAIFKESYKFAIKDPRLIYYWLKAKTLLSKTNEKYNDTSSSA